MHNIEFFLKPSMTPATADKPWEMKKIDYRWIQRNKGNGSYCRVGSGGKLKDIAYKDDYIEGESWEKRPIWCFIDRRVVEGIELSPQIYNALRSEAMNKPAGTLYLAYNFALLFEISKGQSLNEVLTRYNNASPSFKEDFNYMINLVRNSANYRIQVSGYASNEYNGNLQNITGRAQLSNIQLAASRQQAGMVFLQQLGLPMAKIEQGAFKRMSLDLDSSKYNRDRRIQFNLVY